MEYTVLHKHRAEDLAQLVNEHLQSGWQLHGNLCTAFIAREGGGHLLSFAQAMIKEDESLNVFAHGVASPE